jgi:hypothetical protein
VSKKWADSCLETKRREDERNQFNEVLIKDFLLYEPVAEDTVNQEYILSQIKKKIEEEKKKRDEQQ